MQKIEEIIETTEFVCPNTPGREVYAKFSARPDLLAIAVVDSGRPVGLINRSRFFVRFSDTFGRAVYEKRPAALVMDPDPLVVDGALAVSELGAMPAEFKNAALLEGIVVVREGQFAGVTSVLSLYRTLQETNTQLTGLIKAVEESRRLAQEADAAKSRFIAGMSHEFRTPLNAIIGYAELIEEGLAPDDAQNRRDLTAIRRSGQHLLRLINDVIDLAKVEAGRFEIDPEEFDLHEWCETTMSMIRPLAAANRNTLHCDCDGLSGMAFADALRLRQCVLNLAGNSCKFTEDGEVRITLRVEGAPGAHLLTIGVSDTGIGMNPEQIDRLFTPFTQGDSSITRRFGGTGLGLAITQRILERMNGEISVRSALGAGSEFILRVPIERAAREAAA